ncbi:MAG TPA: DUF2911 domain-containing protein [Bacteroidota bacterium]|nr:DUF2911 domain-containing protein [Bacteroidota bacterium]
MINNYSRIILLIACCVVFDTGVFAQRPLQVPRDSTVAMIAGKRISISYGRPSLQGRKIMGDYVQYNKVWRTGAGQATQLTTDADLELGGMEIPRGAYSLYTYPTDGQWKLIINKQVGQWGTVYNSQQDLARIVLDKRQVSNLIEKLTIAIDRGTNGSGTLRIEWEHTSLSVPFRVSPTPIIASPRDSVQLEFGGMTISINYGAPSARGRKIFGSVVPYNQIWRTGANEVTTLKTQLDLTIGGVRLPKGIYSLFTLPTRKGWQLIINKETGQNGLVYHPRFDLARLKLERRDLPGSVERFSIFLDKTDNRSGVLRFEWEKTRLSVPFTVGGR